MAEGWDWTRVQAEACPQCGFDPAEHPLDGLGADLRATAAGWRALLETSAPDDLRRRPEPTTWCALELACHVRDAVTVFDQRIALTLVEDDPELGWWDHEAAVDEQAYAAQDPGLVAGGVEASLGALAAAVEAIPPGAAWDRRAVRRAGEHFTVAGMARFTLHEAVHHLADAEAALAGGGASGDAGG
ncbi:hypothetical protein PO878_09495 [Iamia majanohamensis]|uniref:DinB-like domain-containing protein n=1 Tax=Iamia majanohamensis TaxID=467976 RepID=A0AAE9YI64_9ACTN|nr:DinB family protein [Iamia majanohamensis]WCO68957.1 hypothetical protein PO878_09495 [Iamia majanohamensis]